MPTTAKVGSSKEDASDDNLKKRKSSKGAQKERDPGIFKKPTT